MTDDKTTDTPRDGGAGPGFHETSAWVVLIATLVIYGPFVWNGFATWTADPDVTPRVMPFVWAVAGLVGLIIVGHIVVAIGLATRDGDVDDTFDERDKWIDLKAEQVGSWVQGVGILFVLALALMQESHYLIAYNVIGVMALGTVAMMARKIISYRWGV